MPTKTAPTLESFLDDNPEWRVCPEYIFEPPTQEELRADWPELDEYFIEFSQQIMRPGVTRGAVYVQMRFNGNTHKFADMIASQRGPGVDTDAVFFSGHRTLYEQFGSQKHLNRHLGHAAESGFKPGLHDKYFPELARYQGDPEAFVSRSQGRSYIKKLCEKRGWAIEGAVNVKSREPSEDPLAYENCVPIADDLIQGRINNMARKDPSVLRRSRKDLRREIIEKHGPSK